MKRNLLRSSLAGALMIGMSVVTVPLFAGSAGATTISTYTDNAGCGVVANTTAPAGATSISISIAGARGGSGGTAASGKSGPDGPGGTVTAVYGIYAGQSITVETGCQGQDAPTGSGVSGTGGAGGNGWSAGGTGGDGVYCAGIYSGSCIGVGGTDGSGGGGGGSTAVCLGPTCGVSDTPVAVAAGGGGGGESMCATDAGGTGGTGGNSSSGESTDSLGAGPAGSQGGTGGDGGLAGGAGGVTGSGNQAAGGNSSNQAPGVSLGDTAASGGGGGGYSGGLGTTTQNGNDCPAGGGGGGGSSFSYTVAGNAAAFGTSGSTNGSVSISFISGVTVAIPTYAIDPPGTIPSTPVAPTATASTLTNNATATVDWVVPANGSKTISSFTLTPFIANVAQTAIVIPAGVVSSSTDPTPGASDTYTVTGLTTGTTYTFTIAATNVNGISVASPRSNAVTPTPPAPIVPNNPIIGTGIAGDSAATVQWTAPSVTSGDNVPVITEWIVTPYEDLVPQTPIDVPAGSVGTTTDPTPGASDSLLVSDLTNGTPYQFSVVAVNSVGDSSPSTLSGPVTPATVPGAPTIGTATAGNLEATVSWTAPVSGDGGSAITGYIVTTYVGGVAEDTTSEGNVSEATITGLLSGTAYTFSVQAVNVMGDSVGSDQSNPVTPTGTIGAPTIGPATAGNAQATVTWTMPSDTGGHAITGVVITTYIGGVAQAGQKSVGVVTSAVVTGLHNGTTYTFSVHVTTADGPGAESGQSNPVTPTGPSVTPPPPATGQGYWTDASDGGIFTFGANKFYGSTGAMHLNSPVVGMAATPDNHGYWLVASDGGIFAFGDAGFYGSTGAITLNKPIEAMTSTADGKGYWLVASDGGIFAFGDAKFYGSGGGSVIPAPIVGMAATPDGKGYDLAGANGAVYSFGDAHNYGSAAGQPLSHPIVAMSETPDGKGYWLVGTDGGIFSYGDAVFHGSTGALALNKPIVGMSTTADGKGYWLDASDGGIFAFGDAVFHGSMGGQPLNKPMVGMTI